jgi:hypothetical protein
MAFNPTSVIECRLPQEETWSWTLHRGGPQGQAAEFCLLEGLPGAGVGRTSFLLKDEPGQSMPAFTTVS